MRSNVKDSTLVADTDEDGDFIAKARQAAAQEKLNATSAPTVIGKKRGAGTGMCCAHTQKHVRLVFLWDLQWRLLLGR